MSSKGIAIIGVGIHKFGRFEGKSYQEIGAEAIRMALKDANLSWPDIQVGYCSVDSTTLPKNVGAKTIALLGKTGIGVCDISAACASGGVCLKQGVHAIESGRFDLVLVFGIEKAPRGFLDPNMMGYSDWQIKMGMSTNPSYWAMSCREHMHKYGTTELQLAKIAYKNHKYSVNNPYAMYRKEFSIDEIMTSPIVCSPLHMLEVCAPNEGAAAVILSPLDKAHKYTSKPIIISGSAHTLASYSSDFRVPVSQLSARKNNPKPSVVCSRKAYEEASIGPEDIDVAEVQDTDAFMELTLYEELGFCKVGEGGSLVDKGVTELGGKIPVNLSGGLISKGEPVGASHIGQVVDLVWQLRGELGSRTVKGAKVALAQVIGGQGNTAVTLLRK